MIIAKNNFLRFVIVFALVFLFCYFGALFITGLAVKGGFYSSFVANYFDVAGWLRTSLIVVTKLFVSYFNIEAIRTSSSIGAPAG